MKNFLKLILIIGGLLLGIYIGGYLMLYCGIIQIIDAIRTDTTNSSTIAMGVIKILFSGLGFGLGVILSFITIIMKQGE